MAVHSACEPATGRESGVTGKGPGTFFARWDYQLARALPVAKMYLVPLLRGLMPLTLLRPSVASADHLDGYELGMMSRKPRSLCL